MVAKLLLVLTLVIGGMVAQIATAPAALADGPNGATDGGSGGALQTVTNTLGGVVQAGEKIAETGQPPATDAAGASGQTPGATAESAEATTRQPPAVAAPWTARTPETTAEVGSPVNETSSTAGAEPAAGTSALTPVTQNVSQDTAPLIETLTPVTQGVAQDAASLTNTLAPVTQGVAQDTAPLTGTLTPVTQGVAQDAASLTNTLAPVTQGVAQDTAPLTGTLTPATQAVGQDAAPLIETLEPVTAPVLNAVEPPVKPVLQAMAGTAGGDTQPPLLLQSPSGPATDVARPVAVASGAAAPATDSPAVGPGYALDGLESGAPDSQQFSERRSVRDAVSAGLSDGGEGTVIEPAPRAATAAARWAYASTSPFTAGESRHATTRDVMISAESLPRARQAGRGEAAPPALPQAAAVQAAPAPSSGGGESGSRSQTPSAVSAGRTALLAVLGALILIAAVETPARSRQLRPATPPA